MVTHLHSLSEYKYVSRDCGVDGGLWYVNNQHTFASCP